MQPRSRKVAVFVGSAALATGVGVGVAAQGSDTTPSGATMQQQAGRPGGGMDLSALADELGVTTGELQAAMQAARSAAGGRDAMAAALADELGLSEAKVSAALAANRPDGGKARPRAPADRPRPARARPTGPRRPAARRRASTPRRRHERARRRDPA
jgi:hypothetical protein